MAWPAKVWRLAWVYWLLMFLCPVLAISEALGQDYPAPKDRNHTLDLYQGSAIGSARIVGMGVVDLKIDSRGSGTIGSQPLLGISGRRARTPWNMHYEDDWRDEKALLWGADLVLTGTTKRGAGLEAFGQHQLQPSGRKVSVSIRGGVEYEWLPGQLRVRGGSYYEPSRFKNADGEDISGRLHLTLGLDWHFWSFEVWDYRYRAQLSTWADAAEKFGITGLSLGFWH